MRAALLLLAVLWPAVARAQPVEVSEEAAEEPALARDSGWLELDPLPPTSLEAMAPQEHTEATRVELFPGAVLDVSGTEWSNQDDHRTTPIDLPGRGWRAESRLAVALGGGFLLVANGAVAQSDTQFARGRYVDLSLAVVRTWKLTRWMTAWISLGVGARQWIGKAPDGEVDSTAIQLSIGTTFK
jgi:hypothetical protein